METPFSSLSIPRASLMNKVKDRYLVLTKTGERILVDATSAAEAVEKSGIKDARRVINLAFEAEKILEKGVLGASGENHETRITMEEEVPEFQVADLLEDQSNEEAFIECDLLEFSKLIRLGAPITAEPEFAEVRTPESSKKTAPFFAAETGAEQHVEVAKEVEIIDAPVEHPLHSTEKHLTPEEVEALLKS